MRIKFIYRGERGKDNGDTEEFERVGGAEETQQDIKRIIREECRHITSKKLQVEDHGKLLDVLLSLSYHPSPSS